MTLEKLVFLVPCLLLSLLLGLHKFFFVLFQKKIRLSLNYKWEIQSDPAVQHTHIPCNTEEYSPPWTLTMILPLPLTIRHSFLLCMEKTDLHPFFLSFHFLKFTAISSDFYITNKIKMWIAITNSSILDLFTLLLLQLKNNYVCIHN